MRNKFAAIITTIQPPTAAVEKLAGRLREYGGMIYIAGDKKGPEQFDLDGVHFYSLQDQLASPFGIARKLPPGHYARKNVGYLAAIAAGADCLYETDDDNAPLPSWRQRAETVEAIEVKEAGWVNVYRCFSQERIWPRGFPLGEIGKRQEARGKEEQVIVSGVSPSSFCSPIQQGLVDNSPDVDAVWRLVMNKSFCFESGPSVWLPPGSWCPFNSQSTWWWPEAYPLMYLPSYCSFRMTDIWRSFIAQRCLWEIGYGVVFHGPEVYQERNPHDLMRDFKDEIPGYLRNKEFVAILEKIPLQSGKNSTGKNLFTCYEALIKADFFPSEELELVRTWLEDIARSMEHRAA